MAVLLQREARGAIEWRHWLTLLAWPSIVCMAVGLRIYALGRAEFWYDEAFSRALVELPFARMIAATAGDVHPPLYYSMLWGVARVFGFSELALRLPSAVLSVLALVLARRFGERLGLPRSALMAGLMFMAVSTFQTHYAQEARMYALLEWLVLLGFIAAHDRRWLLLAGCGAALMYTHNYGLFYWALIGLYALVREMTQRPVHVAPGGDRAHEFQPRRLLAALVAPVALYLPWAAVLLWQMRELSTHGWWAWPLMFSDVAGALQLFAFSFALPAWAEAHGIILTGLLTIFVVYRLWRTRRDPAARPARTLTVLIVVVPVIAIVASVVWRPLWLYRALIPVQALCCLLLGWAVTYDLTRWRRVWLAALLAPVLVLAALAYYPFIVDQKGHYTRDVVTPIRAQWNAGDVVVHVNEGSWPQMHAYAPDLPQYLLPRENEYALGGLTAPVISALGISAINLETTTWKRLWVIWTVTPMSAPGEEMRVRSLIAQWPSREVLTWYEDELSRASVWLVQR